MPGKRGCQYQLENTAFREIFGSAVDEWFNNPISKLGGAHQNEFKRHVWRKSYWDPNSIEPRSNQIIHVRLVEPGRPTGFRWGIRRRGGKPTNAD